MMDSLCLHGKVCDSFGSLERFHLEQRYPLLTGYKGVSKCCLIVISSATPHPEPLPVFSLHVTSLN